jgi:hypothetical protein
LLIYPSIQVLITIFNADSLVGGASSYGKS